LLGLSIDSLFAHLGWIANIREKFGIDIPFPVIADHDRRVATLYGMIMPGESKTETSRCLFVIDPKGILRAMIYYPMSTGRSMDEILRLVDALQTSDANAVATPADWKPGQPVILPPPRTIEDARRRLAGGDGTQVRDWYYVTKTL